MAGSMDGTRPDPPLMGTDTAVAMTDEVPYAPNEASTAQPGHGIGSAPLPQGNASAMPTEESLDLPVPMRRNSGSRSASAEDGARKGSAAGASIDTKVAGVDSDAASIKASGSDGRSKKSAYVVDAEQEDADSDDETAGSDEPEEYTTQGRMKDLKSSEANIAPGLKRERWWQIWRPKHGPPRAPDSLETAEVIPLSYVNIVNQLTYWWVTPIMVLGYQRPLQATDLWKMDSSREAEHLSAKFTESFDRRVIQAEEYSRRLDDPTDPARPPRLKRLRWAFQALRPLPSDVASYAVPGSESSKMTVKQRRKALEDEWRGRSGRRKASVVWALDDCMEGFWAGGLFKVVGDTATLMSPLLTKELIKFSQAVYAAHVTGTEGPNIGRGVGLAIGLFCLTILASVCQHQFFFRSMCIGVLARAALICATYKRAMHLTVKSRAMHPNGKLMTHLSSDISRIDYCAQWFHAVWTAPIQLIITMILLLRQIGASALIGMSLFLLITPLQTFFMKQSFKVRQRSMKWTDGRSKLLQELLQSMAIIKQFTYELPFLKRLAFVRGNELKGIRQILIIRAANQAIAFSIPTLAAVVSITAYVGTGHDLNPAVIFTALSYFMLLRQPLMFLPRALSAVTDAQNAVGRLSTVYAADVMEYKDNIDETADVAVRVEDATFEWVVGAEAENIKKDRKDKAAEKGVAEVEPQLAAPFQIPKINLVVPRGQLVAIVGPVGSGKSSLLQGLLGEMQQTAGKITFGGKLSYCQQSAWIQNLSLRDNILFGRPWDEQRYWQAVIDAALPADLELLPDGDLTEIGEKGVTLSGGQKQRVNVARALYAGCDIALFDDPISALDAHVGQYIFNEAILGLKRQGKTVILVTHALHMLHDVDYIYTIDNGCIAEEGTYTELIARNGPFKRLMSDFGGEKEEQKEVEDAAEESAIEATDEKKGAKPLDVKLSRKTMGRAAGRGTVEGRLMVSEIRKTGSVGRKVYAGYMKAGRARYTGPLTGAAAVLMQGAQIMSTLWLTYWQTDDFKKSQSFYMALYAVIGILQAIFTFCMGGSMGILSYFASANLYNDALRNLFHSPMSTFDTTPVGRIMGIFGKDIDTVDNQLADSFRMGLMTGASVIGSVVIITVFLHYFIPVVVFICIGYWYFALFYRSSARELKRLDSMLRSLLYSHFSESLSGLATIRAYGEEKRFLRENAYYMDLEDRAYLLTCANQRWLAIRLDFLGAVLIFVVAIMAAKGGAGISASQIGLVLTYLTSLVQMFGMITRQSAEIENNMNSVERVLHYGTSSLPQEKAHFIEDTKPPKEWPSRGAIEFDNVKMSYRAGLPPVLKGLSLDIKPGEKVGIVGRTGAGKSSITVALYRLVELLEGSIKIDGVDISDIGLNTLRSAIAIIPQQPTLFSGTVRSNLDPFDQWDDARLLDAMRRSCLIGEQAIATDSEKTADPARIERFSLDTPIEEEGSNLSVGERSLVSLARAIVKDAKITLLDEATSSVDLETDERIQQTIQREFRTHTLLCIAHRLRTILGWDRILVMAQGQIQEFGTPLELFDIDGGNFRGMCERSNISRQEIEKAQAQAARFKSSTEGEAPSSAGKWDIQGDKAGETPSEPSQFVLQ